MIQSHGFQFFALLLFCFGIVAALTAATIALTDFAYWHEGRRIKRLMELERSIPKVNLLTLPKRR